VYVSLFLVAFTANKLTEITRHQTDSPFLNEFPESMEGVTLWNLDSHHEYPHVPLTVGEKYSLTLFKCVYFLSYPFPRPDRSPVWALFKLFKQAGVTFLWLLTGTGRSCEFGLTSVRFKSVFWLRSSKLDTPDETWTSSPRWLTVIALWAVTL
jgi:hypothetical protein